jgi:putative Ca2+/H+ antiporter (TMEM165/GDT1 family)
MASPASICIFPTERRLESSMQALLVSFGTVFFGEIGDKTQLLAIMLASRFRQPVPIVAGILAATLANHALAGIAGQWLQTVLPAWLLIWLVGLSFIAVGLWALKPDVADDLQSQRPGQRVFWITTVSFFLAEIGDKTQIATVVLAAKYASLLAVVSGTTLGMLAADVPVVFLGTAFASRLPLKPIRWIAAALFVVLGFLTLLLNR